MKLKDLYGLCGNLNGSSDFEIRANSGFGSSKYIDNGTYVDMHALYGDLNIVEFRINDDRNVTVYYAKENIV